MIPGVPLLVHNTAADQQTFPNSQAVLQQLVQPMSLSSSVHVQEPACKHERAHMQTAPQSNQMLWEVDAVVRGGMKSNTYKHIRNLNNLNKLRLKFFFLSFIHLNVSDKSIWQR